MSAHTDSAPAVERLVVGVVTECLHQRHLAPELRDLRLLDGLLQEVADADAAAAASRLVGMLASSLERLGAVEDRDPLELLRELAGG